MKRKENISNLFLRLFIRKSSPLVDLIIITVLIIAFTAVIPKVYASYKAGTEIRLALAQAEQKKIEETAPEDLGYEALFLPEKSDLIAALREDAERLFYMQLTRNNYRVVSAIYQYSEGLNKDFLFALAEHESGFCYNSTNENVDKRTGRVVSTDRGIFQLNSRSYPGLTTEEFYQIELNVMYGIQHIRGELAYNKGNARKALWSYNAGRSRLNAPPEITIRYANIILARTQALRVARETFVQEKLKEYESLLD